MSKRAQMYVRGLRVRPGGSRAGRRFTSAEMRVLGVLAGFYKDGLECAFASNGVYAEALGWTVSYLRGVLAGLEECGVVQRTAQVRCGRVFAGSQATNCCDFPLMGYAAGRPMGSAAKNGSAVDGSGPMCSAGEWPMRRAAWQQMMEARAEYFVDRRVPMNGGADGLSRPVQMPLLEVGDPPDSEVGGVPDSAVGGPPDSEAPSEYYGDVYGEQNGDRPPHTLPPAATDCASSIERRWTRQEPEATARAKATATTSERQVASGAQDGVGSAGARSGVGARPWEVRQRRERRARGVDVRELDGEEAAWHAEVTRVMDELGLLEGSLRQVLLGAMRKVVGVKVGSIAEAGDLVVERFLDYYDGAIIRRWHSQPRAFFRDGLWLRPASWSVDVEAMRLRAMQQAAEALRRGAQKRDEPARSGTVHVRRPVQ